MERLVASSPVLVHFFDFAQLNSMRALPYVLAWRERYSARGLRVLGAHSPRFPFTRSPDAVRDAVERLGIEHPVAVDSEHLMWKDYGCRGWPSLFLWGAGGSLRWYQLGEGEYAATEQAVREAVDDANEGSDPVEPLQALEPLRPSDVPGARVMPPTEEIFPGGSPERPWRPTTTARSIEIEYEAGGAHAAVDGRGELRVVIDGGDSRTVEIAHPGLFELAEHPGHEAHSLELGASAEIAVYAVSFAAGVP